MKKRIFLILGIGSLILTSCRSNNPTTSVIELVSSSENISLPNSSLNESSTSLSSLISSESSSLEESSFSLSSERLMNQELLNTAKLIHNVTKKRNSKSYMDLLIDAGLTGFEELNNKNLINLLYKSFKSTLDSIDSNFKDSVGYYASFYNYDYLFLNVPNECKDAVSYFYSKGLMLDEEYNPEAYGLDEFRKGSYFTRINFKPNKKPSQDYILKFLNRICLYIGDELSLKDNFFGYINHVELTSGTTYINKIVPSEKVIESMLTLKEDGLNNNAQEFSNLPNFDISFTKDPDTKCAELYSYAKRISEITTTRGLGNLVNEIWAYTGINLVLKFEEAAPVFNSVNKGYYYVAPIFKFDDELYFLSEKKSSSYQPNSDYYDTNIDTYYDHLSKVVGLYDYSESMIDTTINKEATGFTYTKMESYVNSYIKLFKDVYTSYEHKTHYENDNYYGLVPEKIFNVSIQNQYDSIYHHDYSKALLKVDSTLKFDFYNCFLEYSTNEEYLEGLKAFLLLKLYSNFECFYMSSSKATTLMTDIEDSYFDKNYGKYISYELMNYYMTTDVYSTSVTRCINLFNDLKQKEIQRINASSYLSSSSKQTLITKLLDQDITIMNTRFDYDSNGNLEREGYRYFDFENHPYTTNLFENICIFNTHKMNDVSKYLGDQSTASFTYNQTSGNIPGSEKIYHAIYHPFYTNAFNTSIYNSIIILAGYITSVGLDVSTISNELFYSDVAIAIGHEITHSVDSNSIYNGNDHKTYQDSIIDQKDIIEYEERVDKVVALYSFYSEIVGIDCDNPDKSGEEIADLGGLTDTELIVKDIDGFDYVTFYKNVAKKFSVINSRAIYMVNDIKTDVHPVFEARVNSMLKNSKKFHETFSITEEDLMYLAPEEIVSIW